MNAPMPPSMPPTMPRVPAATRGLGLSWWRLAGLLLVALISLLGIASATIWTWAATEGSLARGLAWAQRALPVGQTLDIEGVQGSLRAGGRIERLRWARQSPEGPLTVELRELVADWSISELLLTGRLQLTRLSARDVDVTDGRAASTQAPSPPAPVVLPVPVDLPLQVGHLRLRGAVDVDITDVSARYHFEGQRHRVELDHLTLAAATYEGQATLGTDATQPLELQLQARLDAPLPGRAPLPLQLEARARGPIGQATDVLDIEATLLPRSGARAMQARLKARVRPWQSQPIEQAEADWQALDLALLWPQAPQTSLAGQARVLPAGRAAWRVSASARNDQPGPWDQRRLPVSTLAFEGRIDEATLTVQSLQAQVAGGALQAEGRWLRQTAAAAGLPRGWQGQARLTALDPSALWSTLPAERVSGQFDAQVAAGSTPARVEFVAALAADRRPELGRLQAEGSWDGTLLALRRLLLSGPDARVEAQARWQPLARSGQGTVTARWPGGRVDASGQLAAREGTGQIDLGIDDATTMQRWIERAPWLRALPTALQRALRQQRLTGKLDANLRWQGGWQDWQRQGRIDAQVRSPEFSARLGDTPTWTARDLRATLRGTLADLQIEAAVQGERAGLRVGLDTRSRVQLASSWGEGRADISRARIDVAGLSTTAITAHIELAEALDLRWSRGGRGSAPHLELGAARWTLGLRGAAGQPAAGGTARLSWDASRVEWGADRPGLRTRGRLDGLPQSWLEAVGNTQLAALGLAGDLVFDGQWDVDTLAGAQRLSADLMRRSGDIQLLGADAGERIRAGVREARLSLREDAGRLVARLRWDSANAGQIDAEASTRGLQAGQFLAADAPLSGQLTARLPQVGLWSVFAPPGWRLRGTLSADARLSGTLGTPQWQGQFAARDLALRSVVDGIEFTDGALQARLDGQRLLIERFLLRGAGATGGELQASGEATWLPATRAGQPMAERLRIALEAQARALRVSARADRRLAVSGQVKATLEAARLQVRGQLAADQALFILPEDSAPSLSDDVRVRPRAGERPASAATSTPSGIAVLPDVELQLDLGRDFRLQGLGITTRLAGALVLRSVPEGNRMGPLRLTGDVRTLGGRYKAYGQNLDIEQGLLRFTGAYDNPTLAVLAIRPNLTQRVGVQITGTALAPRVRLFAEPDLPEAEKLAWLVLGRAAAAGGAESAVLQQAALALLGGNGKGLSGGLAEALGLDELSVRGASTASDGSTSSAAVTLGKRLSRNFYVAYERSLAGTLGTFYIFYDLSRRFTLRAQTGEQSAVDLIFTLNYE
jgi:translocation and assembly module TamB